MQGLSSPYLSIPTARECGVNRAVPYDVKIEALTPFGMIDIRGKDDVREICNSILGVSLPTTANTVVTQGVRVVFCISPDHWLVRTSDGEEVALSDAIREKTAGLFKAVTVVSDNYLTFRIAGTDAVDVLMQGMRIDLHPSVFRVNSCARTSFAQTTALLYKLDGEPTFDICIYRSYRTYIQEWFDYVIGLPNATAVNVRR